MLQNVAPEITIASFSIIGVLTGYVWNNQSRRLEKLEGDVEKCPFPDIRKDIAKIQNDIDWIKRNILKN